MPIMIPHPQKVQISLDAIACAHGAILSRESMELLAHCNMHTQGRPTQTWARQQTNNITGYTGQLHLNRKDKEVCTHQAALPQNFSSYEKTEQQGTNYHTCMYTRPPWSKHTPSGQMADQALNTHTHPDSNLLAKISQQTVYTEATFPQDYFLGLGEISI